jgi:hypothetical protein
MCRDRERRGFTRDASGFLHSDLLRRNRSRHPEIEWPIYVKSSDYSRDAVSHFGLRRMGLLQRAKLAMLQ